MSRILVFGASITYGEGDLKGGWVQRLRSYFDEKGISDPDFDYSVYNLGISGDTTEDLLERFEFETLQRFQEEKELIIFSIGHNDSQIFYNSKKTRTPTLQFKENLQKLINIARKFSTKIIFIGLTPVDDLRVDPIPWFPKFSYKNESVKNFNNIIKRVCNKNRIYFIEIFEKWTSIDYKNLLEDGVHPNSEGHQKIFEIVRDFLIDNKIVHSF